MQLTPVTTPAFAAPSAQPVRTAPDSFASVLQVQRGDRSPEQAARDAAEQFVAQSLVQPVFAQLRGSSHAAPPFAPGEAEKTFRPLLDAELARRIVSARQFPLVDAVARNLLKHTRPTSDTEDLPPKTEGVPDERDATKPVGNGPERRPDTERAGLRSAGV
jgi:Rod binding domain-containing protein